MQRYFRAAAEAAHEVLAEQGASALDSRVDVLKLTDSDSKSLNSPSRMVALNLANGNPLFRWVIEFLIILEIASPTLPFAVSTHYREKLKKKLEVEGALCNMEDLTSGGFVETSEFNIMEKKKATKKMSSVPGTKSSVSGKGSKSSREEERSKGSSAKPPKGKQHKKDFKNKRGEEDDYDSSTLMKRRRKAELQIQVEAHVICFIS